MKPRIKNTTTTTIGPIRIHEKEAPPPPETVKGRPAAGSIYGFHELQPGESNYFPGLLPEQLKKIRANAGYWAKQTGYHYTASIAEKRDEEDNVTEFGIRVWCWGKDGVKAPNLNHPNNK